MYFFLSEEFKRAVLVTTGHQLADHLVHTVFQIFDTDGKYFSVYGLTLFDVYMYRNEWVGV